MNIFKHFQYWRLNDRAVYKEALLRLLCFILLPAAVGVGVFTVMALQGGGVWWIGLVVFLIGALICGYNIYAYCLWRYLNCWAMGVKGADRALIMQTADERWHERERKRRAKTEHEEDERKVSKRHPNRIRESKIDITLNIINLTMLFLFIFVVCFPLLNYFSLSFNDGNFNLHVVLFPVRPSVEAFRYVLAGEGAIDFWQAFGNSVFITLLVTIVSNLMMALAAYPLSKRDYPLRGGILMFFVITMLFSAGIIPIYMLMSMMNLLNTVWSIILISRSNVAHMLYYKTFFEGIPSDIEEAAKLDGASELQLFFLIVIPMSLPIIGTCCFFTIVGCWNGYGSALMFISRSAKQAHPLAYYIYLMLENTDLDKNNPWLQMNAKNVEAAAMLVSIIPIICMYPYVVKYIKGGLQLGSVKG